MYLLTLHHMNILLLFRETVMTIQIAQATSSASTVITVKMYRVVLAIRKNMQELAGIIVIQILR